MRGTVVKIACTLSANPEDDAGMTRWLQKGVVLERAGRRLCEEGMGFGVPVLVCGMRTYLSRSAELVRTERGGGPAWEKTFHFDAIERTSWRGREVTSRWPYALQELRGHLYKRSRTLQRLLPVANRMNERAGLAFDFVPTDSRGSVTVSYAFTGDHVEVSVGVPELESGVRRARLYILNEQGATMFSRYRDDHGLTLDEAAIGGWIEVASGRAWLTTPDGAIGFGIEPRPPARLYRGWERVDGVLSWAGFTYDVSHLTNEAFEYAIELKHEAGVADG